MSFFIFVFIADLQDQLWNDLSCNYCVKWQVEIEKVLVGDVHFSKNRALLEKLSVPIVLDIEFIFEPIISMEENSVNLA